MLRAAPAVVGEDILAAALLQGPELKLGILVDGGHSGIAEGDRSKSSRLRIVAILFCARPLERP